MPARFLALLLLALPMLAHAQSAPAAERQAEWNARLEQAARMRQTAGEQKSEAERRFQALDASCYEKFQVNACRDEASRERNTAIQAARRMENEAKLLELGVKKAQRQDEDARRAAEEPARQEMLKTRQEQKAAEMTAGEAERAAILAEKEKRAEEGKQRLQANEARAARKRAEHDAAVAAQIREAEAKKANEKAK